MSVLVDNVVAARPVSIRAHRAPAGFPLPGLVRLVLEECGQDGWTLQTDGFWCRVRPPHDRQRIQGWKLHVSATPLSAAEVLHRAATVLINEGCAFKFAASADNVLELTSGRYDRAQCGKFITAYPCDDEHLRRVAEALDEVTAGLPGPAILSDRPYRDGSLVSYRYGAFRGVSVLTNDGAFEAQLEDPDGRPVPDVRKPWFAPPAWADLPFPITTTVKPALPKPVKARPVLIGDRYLVQEAIIHSSRGGVYRAIDRHTGTNVIVKQARAHVGAGLDGKDARDAIRREAAMLTELAGLAPQLVELIETAGHTFLVETLVAGTPLTAWVQEKFGEMGWQGGLPNDLTVTMARRLRALLDEVHRRGVVYGDFTPNNIIVTPANQVLLIDAESAYRAGEPGSRAGTPGFMAPENRHGGWRGPALTPSSDLYSLGGILFYLVTGINPAMAPDEPVTRPGTDRLALLLRLVGAANPAARLMAPAILGLCRDKPDQRWSGEAVRVFLADPEVVPAPTASTDPGPGADPTALDPATYRRLVDDGLDHILATENSGTGRIWPSNSFGETTEPGNVQHGAAGVLALLCLADEALGRDDLRTAAERVARWIDRRTRETPRALPGLYFGQSGTAWALHTAARHLADDALAQRAEELALAVPVVWPNPDVFHGAAGAGLTQLHMWQATGNADFLDRTRLCADGLLAAAEQTDDGVFWPVPSDFNSSMAGIHHFGFAHGVAGVGTFLLEAARATDRPDCLEAARAAGRTLARAAEHGPWGVRWRNDRSDPPGTGMLYHVCSGAAGVGTFLLRLWQATGDPVARELAEQAATAVYRTRWSANSAACHGLAGNGQFLLDMASALDGPYQGWAEELAVCLFARHALRDGRMLVPDESSSRFAIDYQIGLAGVLGFLIRLRHGGPHPWLVTR